MHTSRSTEDGVRNSRPAIVASLFALFMVHPPAFSQEVPSLIAYQGRLLNGTNLVNGNVGLSLRLFTSPTGGSPIYVDSNSVAVVDGLYTTLIGDDTNSTALTEALTNAQVWIEATVNGTTLTPRERVASVAYSLKVAGLLVDTNGSVVLAPSAPNTIDPGSGGSSIGGGVSNSISASSPAAVISGGNGNRIQSDVAGGAIGGGENNTVEANAQHATIAGGRDNTINLNATRSAIGGGQGNAVLAGADYATIAGGLGNEAGGIGSTVAGGVDCDAANTLSFAAGNRAKAGNVGAFVWADSQDFDFASTATDQFNVRAVGGARIVSGLDGFGDPASGVELAPGGGSWTSLSDVNAKRNFTPVDGRSILDKVSVLPIHEWSYKSQPDTVRHIGPTAQDFHAAFGVGDKPTGITSVDADGVALAAIQALARRDDELGMMNDELKKENEALKARLGAIERKLGL